MATRPALVFALGLTLASPAVFAPVPARAQDEEVDQGHVENAKFQFEGKANSTVFVRSGPSNNFYPTMKLEKGAAVTVVGIKYEWLKILPPPGSFSYVPKAYVERRGAGGKIARVTNKLNVRAGSTENSLKTTVQLELVEGQDVEVLDEVDEYLKVVPPEGAYLFVHKQYIDPVGPGKKAPPDAGGGTIVKQPTAPAIESGDEPAEPGATPGAEDEGTAEDPTPERRDAVAGTQPSGGDAGAQGGGAAAAAKTAAAAAAEDFRQLEAEYEAASKRPVVDQPIGELTARYTKLVKAGSLTGSMKRMADARLMVLGMRADAREQLLAFRKTQDDLLATQRELQAEKAEIDEQIERTKVTLFAAVGLLKVSSLQRGEATLYRLTDPATGRTVAYLRSNDPKLPALLNQFVGVRGDVTSDARLALKIVTATEAEAVDPKQVNGTVIATITPPSMVTPTITSIDAAESATAE